MTLARRFRPLLPLLVCGLLCAACAGNKKSRPLDGALSPLHHDGRLPGPTSDGWVVFRDQRVPTPPTGIAFDSASTTAVPPGDGAKELSVEHTTGAEGNRLLLLGLAARGDATIVSVTYAGTPLKKLRHDGAGTDARTELWYLVAPPSGKQPLRVEVDRVQHFVIGVTSWAGVDPATPFVGTGAGATGDAKDLELPLPSEAGQLAVDVVTAQFKDAELAPGAGQSRRWSVKSEHNEGASSSAPGAADLKLRWSQIGTPQPWALSAVALRPMR